MELIREKRENCKPSVSFSYDFFINNPERRAFFVKSDPDELKLIDVGSRDPVERVRRLRIMRDLGFEAITVDERTTGLRHPGGFYHTRTPLLVHCDVALVNDEKTAQILTVFDNRHIILPGFKHLSAFTFWHNRWSDDFIVGGRARIGSEQMLRWAGPRKPEVALIEVRFDKAARALAFRRRKMGSNLRFRRSQCVVDGAGQEAA